MKVVKRFLKWFLLMCGIIGAVGFVFAALTALFSGQFIFAAGSAVATAFCIAMAITSFECMR